MRESAAMTEIRKIRDKNSLRHLNMSSDEIAKEYAESVKKFMEHIGRDIKIVSHPTTKS